VQQIILNLPKEKYVTQNNFPKKCTDALLYKILRMYYYVFQIYCIVTIMVSSHHIISSKNARLGRKLNCPWNVHLFPTLLHEINWIRFKPDKYLVN